jgi:hypothetical protein
MKQRLSFDRRAATAGQLVTRARIFYDVWYFYEGASTRPSLLDTMNEYPEFFRFDSHAQIVAFIVHIAALFETRKDTFNFPQLVKDAELVVSHAARMDLQALLVSAKPLAVKAAVLRNHLFGHTYEEAFRAASVTPEILRELTEIGLHISNLLLRARDLGERSFHLLSAEHVAEMLRKLAAA